MKRHPEVIVMCDGYFRQSCLLAVHAHARQIGFSGPFSFLIKCQQNHSAFRNLTAMQSARLAVPAGLC